jgi:hypothetical protein
MQSRCVKRMLHHFWLVVLAAHCCAQAEVARSRPSAWLPRTPFMFFAPGSAVVAEPAVAACRS